MNKKRVEPDYYRILGIGPLASKREIKRAYRARALRHHPDHNPDSSEESRDAFLLVSEAYEVLYNDARRAHYDRKRRGGGGRNGSKTARESPWSMGSIWSAYRADKPGPFKEWRAGPNPRAVRRGAVCGGILGLVLGACFGLLFLGVAGMNWAMALMGACAGVVGGLSGSALGAAFHAFGPQVGYCAGGFLGVLGAWIAAGLLALFVDPHPQVDLNGFLPGQGGDVLGVFMYGLFLTASLAGAAAGAFFSQRAYLS